MLCVISVNAALVSEREVIMNVSFPVLSSATKAPPFIWKNQIWQAELKEAN